MAKYKVYKRNKSGIKFDSTIEGKNWRYAWNYYKNAGHFTSGKYIVTDGRGKNHYVTH